MAQAQLPLIKCIEFIIINDQNDLTKFTNHHSTLKSISVDLEGERLCRNGRITKIQIYLPEKKLLFIFDCSKLNVDELKNVLKPIFESGAIKKYFFDCRADVDALYHQYGINLVNVIDVQLFEIGYRKSIQKNYNTYGENRYSGLYNCLKFWSKRLEITQKELDIKKEICNQFNEKKYDMDLNDEKVKLYLAIDVIYLDKLAKTFSNKIKSKDIIDSISAETKKRVDIWQKVEYLSDKSNAISVI